MKKIKLLVSCLMIFILFLGLTLIIDKKDYSYYLVMGDYISHNQVFDSQEVVSFSNIVGDFLLQEDLIQEVNSQYLKNNMTSKQMLEIIESNSYKKDEKNLQDLIKKSEYISISLGINDIASQIKYNSNKKALIYDEDIIEQKIGMFKHNYHEILDEIKQLNKDAKIVLIGCYGFYNQSEVSSMLNDAVNEVAMEFEAYYVDVSDITDKYMYQENELYLTDLGQEEVSKKVISLIKEIEQI